MALVFCTTCEKIIDDRSLIPKLKRICPRCRKKLVYFGREEVSLSPEEIIAEYDDKLSVLKKYFADSKKKEVLNG